MCTGSGGCCAPFAPPLPRRGSTAAPPGRRECIFYTGYSRGLRPYHDLFYQPLENGRWGKRLPSNLADLLQDPLSLLVWYLDDGTLRGDCNSCRLATQGFSLEEHHQRNLLRDNFLVGSRFRWRRKRGGVFWGLVIPARDFRTFRGLLEDLCRQECASMLYKLVRKPRND